MTALRHPEENVPPLAGNGEGQLSVEIVRGESAVISARSVNPLRILVPRPHGPSVWAYLSSLGGGMVAGDQVRIDVNVGRGARCFLSTQSSTKVYRDPAMRPCVHRLRAALDSQSILVLAPDLIQSFAGSSFSQIQEFHLQPDSGLVLLDWYSAGRTACGERWAFTRFRSRNEVFLGEDRLLMDSVLLDAEDGPIDAHYRMGRYNCLAVLLLIGPTLHEAAEHLCAEVGAKPVEHRASLIASASGLRHGALVRLAGVNTEEVRARVQHYLSFLASLLGDDPWARKW